MGGGRARVIKGEVDRAMALWSGEGATMRLGGLGTESGRHGTLAPYILRRWRRWGWGVERASQKWGGEAMGRGEPEAESRETEALGTQGVGEIEGGVLVRGPGGGQLELVSWTKESKRCGT